MNNIQSTEPSFIQWNIFIDYAVRIIAYKMSTIDHATHVKLFSNGTVSYIDLPMYDVLNNTYNNEEFQ